MWYGGYESRSQFYRNVSIVESIIAETGDASFKEIVEYIHKSNRVFPCPQRIAAAVRQYLKNGRPSTFSDVPND